MIDKDWDGWQKPMAWLEPELGETICLEIGFDETITEKHPRNLGWIPLYAHPPKEKK